MPVCLPRVRRRRWHDHFLMIITFFSFVLGFTFMTLSRMSRQFLQISRYCYNGDKPPLMLNVTDGGVCDCTAIVQLMRRRCKRILLVLAAGDAGDNLGVLKSAMEYAAKEKVGSFFDIDEPRRCLEVLLDNFKRYSHLSHFRLGICYSWDANLGAVSI